MRNPYEVLGIREGATKEQIKEAYLKMVKKYHPDRHQDNPLNELAQERLKEINEAYDYLTKNPGYAGPGSDYGAGTARTYTSGSSASPEFNQVRMDINQGNLAAAEAALNRSQARNAEWFFLTGVLNMRKGWFDEALNNLQVAVSMEPNNMEYRSAINSLLHQSGAYRTAADSHGYGLNRNDELCRMLQCYCCADLLCDCF
ncbi:MAG TPA: DnaJ domain-containing protein [Clostridiales bacterium]|jgi:molecular chaperone DnaJ|nr:DnaJ domain-containing protein [Clostridiales bacterium]